MSASERQRATPERWSKSALRTMQHRGVPTAENDALSHGMALVAVPVFLGFLGYLLDGELGTGWVFAALFAVFGVASAFGSAYYRYERRIADHDEGKPWARGRGAARHVDAPGLDAPGLDAPGLDAEEAFG